MFHKTRVRLVLLNAIVFFFILNGFGATLYFYMQYRLYAQVDGHLHDIALRIQHGDVIRGVMDRRNKERDRDSLLVWDVQGNLLQQIPPDAFPIDQIHLFHSQLLHHNSFQTLFLGDTPYRVYQINLPDREKTIQILYDMQYEHDMLESLLFVIAIGAIISVVLAIISGLFLANRALIPIQNSWKKQQQFTADASHELRTPLTVMKLYLERLFRHPDHTVEQESEHISVMIMETKRMIQMVNDLLTLARSDSNEIQLIKQTVHLDATVKRTVNQFQDMAALKSITLETNIESALEMTGDEERLHQLFVILLDNAVKYTEEYGTITVTCKKTGTKHGYLLQVSVQDTGAGIPEQDLPYIFDRFYRGDKARTRKEGGTGLGLSIAKWIIDAHDGKIRVESKMGIGTTIIVSFPVKKL
ncbi:cell wall metabolism sensor histidine kinase WalK [Fodinisporobacter ferrooxydans]|uniref:histidine kinase n=1 Tax=Fodinisporobacter ferrooxydans TaxID=2901836 RepID=A0ABY4CDK4_9BACL|nr:cell wall metabolism sensor histidine kinase WalK [Alicyclobacillaceae bacterium MYW30-H2]